jgi:glyoxylase-like metal-dependent hydrolase (beta-lactamase superfamily II)
VVSSLQLGEFRIFALEDGAAELQGWPMSPELDGGDRVQWAKYAERSPGGFHGPDHRWRIHNTCFLVQGAGQLVLVDCGVGVGPYPWYQGIRGALLNQLAATGFSPADVTQVFLTHAHPDHVGWTYDEDARAPRFPNARYRLHLRDWHFFADRGTVPKHFTRFVAPLRSAGALDLLTAETEIAPGLTALETPGHTGGHMSLLIQSGGEGLVIAGDVLNSPMYVTEPGRPFGSDADQQLGVSSRVALMERVVSEGWKVAAAHFPSPGWGDVVQLEGRRWWRGGTT